MLHSYPKKICKKVYKLLKGKKMKFSAVKKALANHPATSSYVVEVVMNLANLER